LIGHSVAGPILFFFRPDRVQSILLFLFPVSTEILFRDPAAQFWPQVTTAFSITLISPFLPDGRPRPAAFPIPLCVGEKHNLPPLEDKYRLVFSFS